MIAIIQTQQALLQTVKVFHPALAKNTTRAILGDEKEHKQKTACDGARVELAHQEKNMPCNGLYKKKHV